METGPEYRGKGLGTRFLLHHGFWPDYAVVVEGSRFCLAWAMPGVIYLKISTFGRPSYIPFVNHGDSPQGSENAIIRMAHLINVLQDWAKKYETTNKYNYAAGTMVPKALIGAIDGGRPTKPNCQAGICSIYMDIRVLPDRDFLDLVNEVEEVIESSGINAKVELFMSQRGYEAQNIEPLVDSVKKSHVKYFGKEPEKISVADTSMWTDINIYNQNGIPSLKYAPSPDIPFHNRPDAPRSEGIAISGLLDAAKLYALIALDMCNRSR